jgi:hypothetical protein
MEWNKKQLSIALEISKGKKGFSQIAAEYGVVPSYITKIKNYMKKHPPDLSEEALANAKESEGFAVYQHPKKTEEETVEEEGSEEETDEPIEKPAPSLASKENGSSSKNQKPKPTIDGVNPGSLKFSQTTVQTQFTPIMYMGKLAAVNQWGWPEDMLFEEFLDTIILHFFRDRGIVLQAYVVLDDEEETEEVTA